MAQRRTARRTSRRRTPARRRRRTTARRRSYRRNPTYRRNQFRGVFGQLQRGVVDAAGVVTGKAATRFVANLVPIGGQDLFVNVAKQAGAAIVVGMVSRRFLGQDWARMMLAGGLAAPVESFLSGLPVIGPMLGDYNPFLPMGIYPEQGLGYNPFLPVGEYTPAYEDGMYDEGMGIYPEPIVGTYN